MKIESHAMGRDATKKNIRIMPLLSRIPLLILSETVMPLGIGHRVKRQLQHIAERQHGLV